MAIKRSVDPICKESKFDLVREKGGLNAIAAALADRLMHLCLRLRRGEPVDRGRRVCNSGSALRVEQRGFFKSSQARNLRYVALTADAPQDEA